MAKAAKLLMCVAVVTLVAGPLMAQDAISAQRQAQAKALALRAARADAMRKLGEKIQGLFITSDTKVKDFVAESDVIRTAMQAFLLGMREPKGYKPTFSEDGVATVKLEVTLDEVIEALRRIRSKYYKDGVKFKDAYFLKMTTTNKLKIITAEGQGAPREEQVEDEMVPSESGSVSFSAFSVKVKSYWKKYCTARGRLMAERAARVDGMRRLAERIKGVAITSTTTVKDFVAESDDINVSMRTFIRGAKEIGVRYHSDDLICEVEMQIKLKQVYEMLHSWAKVHYTGDKMKMRQLTQKTTTTEIKILKETGMGVPPAKYLKKAPKVVEEVIKLAAQTPPWATITLSAVGQGAIDIDNANVAQAKLMAKRAAELDGRRKLAERINGLAITSNTRVKDFVAESDEIRTSMMTFQAGAYVVDAPLKVEDGIVTVTVEIEMKPLWTSIIFYKKKLGLAFN